MTKWPKPKENQLGILKICRRERCWGYVSMRMHLKNYIFPLKVAKTLSSASRKDTTGA